MAQTDAQKRAKEKYNTKAYDDIRLRLIKGNKEILQTYCKDNGLTINGFINKLIQERLQLDGVSMITETVVQRTSATE